MSRISTFKTPALTIAPVLTIALAAVLGSCASAPSSHPRLTQLESELKAAYGDKYVAEYGHDDLARAQVSLADARVAIRKGRDTEMQHDLTMAENHIALGEIHGRQERTKAETVALKDRQDQVRLAARDRDIRKANDRAATSRADAAMANAASQDANARAELSRAEAMAANAATQAAEDKTTAMRDQLKSYDMKITELGATLVLRDVMFDVNSAVLRAGAVNRLDPLISYLRSSPAVSVRIEGHTDSTGSVEHNNDLSLNRANSVRMALLASNSVSNPIETYGYGQSKPVASNATISGREQNRRVEVTLK